MQFCVEGWDPGYGSPVEMQELINTASKVDTTLEVSSVEWAPIAPKAANVPDVLLFVDGVRRIDARAWIDDAPAANGGGRRAVPGLCASYAAGVVRSSPRGAKVVVCEVRRALFTDAATADDIRTASGTYHLHHVVVPQETPANVALTNAIQRALSILEVTVAVESRANAICSSEDDLLIVDGPLRGRDHLPRALGYIKTHQAQYLPTDLNGVVAELKTGERSPVFAIGAGWDRYSWYLRLPCLPAGPWAGIVRLEAATSLKLAEVVALADVSQNLLGRFASVEYKDGRAPQNLTPISGLERGLKHELGLAPLVYRNIRSAAVPVAITP